MDSLKNETFVAVLDVDGTLIEDNIGITFAKHLIKNREVKLLSLTLMIILFILYRVKLVGFDYMIKAGAWAVARKPIELIREQAQLCFNEEIKPKIYRDALSEIRKLKDDNYKIIIATGAHESIASILFEYLEIDGCIATTSDVKNGIYGYSTNGTLPFRDGKKDLVKNFIRSNFANDPFIRVYADDEKDIPLMSLAHSSIGVNPDEFTKKYIQNNGGEIRYFS